MSKQRTIMCMLVTPCAKCGTLWANVTGNASKVLSTRCYVGSHLLTGLNARLKKSWRRRYKMETEKSQKA